MKARAVAISRMYNCKRMRTKDTNYRCRRQTAVSAAPSETAKKLMIGRYHYSIALLKHRPS